MNPWRGLTKLPKEVWILALATLVNRAGTMVLPFLVLYITQVLGVSAGRAALALTVYGAAALLTSPLAGWLSDRAGELGVMKAALFLSGAMMLVLSHAGSFVALLALVFLWAIFNEAVRPASLAVVADFVPSAQRKQAYALSRLAVNLGMSVGPAVGGFLAIRSFHALFYVDGLTSILAGLVLVVSPWRESPRRPLHEPEWPEPEDLGREIEADSVEPLAAVSPAADLRAFRSRSMLHFLAGMIPAQLVFFQLLSTTSLFLVRSLHLPESRYGALFTINTLMIVLIEVPLNTATERWSHRRTLTLGALLYAVGFGSFAFAKNIAQVIAGVVVFTFGEMILLPGSAAYAAEIAPAERRGEYMGLYTMSFNLSFAIGPWLGAQIFERHGPQALWGAAFFSGCFSALLMSRIGPEAQRRRAMRSAK